MTERDLRTAFEHLKEDVMHNVKTEERLDQITRRRTRVRPAVMAFAGAAAVALIVGAAVLAFRPDTERDPVPPATGSTVAPPTTVVDTTMPPDTTPPIVTPGLDLTDDEWVLHSIDGITTSASNGVVFATTPDFWLVNLARDQLGGIAFTDATGLWWWQADTTEPELVTDTPGLQLIEVIPTGNGPVARISAGNDFRYIDLATGADVEPIAGRVDVPNGFPQQIRRAANGLTARIVQRIADPEGSGAADEPARLIIEREGEVVLDVRIADPGQWARLHDFDGRHAIVSYGPFEPALPPETYLVIDLTCAECTQTFVATAANAALTGPDVETIGEIADFGDSIEPTSPLPDLSPGTPLVATGDGVTAVTTDGTAVIPIATPDGAEVTRAVGDGAGGLFVQVGNTIGWIRADAPAINLFSGSELWEDEIELRLQDVAVIDGGLNLIVVTAGGVEEQRYEEVIRYEVATGSPYVLYHTGAYEGGITRASFAGDTLVVTRHAEGFSWFEFFNSEGQPIDVGNPKPDTAAFPVFVDQGVLSPDGSTLVYLESDAPAPPEDNNWRIDLVVFDLANGVEDRRMEIELGNWYADRMDFDGIGIVLGRVQWNGFEWEAGTPLRVESLDADAGIVTELDVIGTPSLVK